MTYEEKKEFEEFLQWKDEKNKEDAAKKYPLIFYPHD